MRFVFFPSSVSRPSTTLSLLSSRSNITHKGEVEALLPVIGMLLQFSPDEIRKCQQAYRSNVVASSPSASVESTPRSLFSRFSFTG